MPSFAGTSRSVALVERVVPAPSFTMPRSAFISLYSRVWACLRRMRSSLRFITSTSGSAALNALYLIPMTIQDGYGKRNTIRYLVPAAPAQATAAQPASRAASAIIWSENPAPPWR